MNRMSVMETKTMWDEDILLSFKAKPGELRDVAPVEIIEIMYVVFDSKI